MLPHALLGFLATQKSEIHQPQNQFFVGLNQSADHDGDLRM
jgi:hypothetical protein